MVKTLSLKPSDEDPIEALHSPPLRSFQRGSNGAMILSIAHMPRVWRSYSPKARPGLQRAATPLPQVADLELRQQTHGASKNQGP